jgi:hypothetical protein
MHENAMRRAGTRGMISMLAACAAALWFATAGVAAPLSPIAITPSSGCGLLTSYTAGTGLPAWSGPTPSCGTQAFTLAFNQGNTPPPGTLSQGGVRTAGSALSQAWRLTGVPDGARMGYQISAPPGITINEVGYDDSQLQNIANGRGWIGFTYWNGGTAPVHSNGTAVDAAASGRSLDSNLNTFYWGIELRCVQSVCSWPGLIQLDHIVVYASEAQGPSITPVADPGSLWAQTGHWIWNAPGDSWPLDVSADDASGVCSLTVAVGTSAPIADSSLPATNSSSWQECQQPVSWTAALDTRDYISGAGQVPLTLQATNSAGPATQASMSETLSVDNDPVGVSLSTPNDSNPTVWVNHAVTVDATSSTGPSGLGGVDCSVNGAAAQGYPAGGLPVNGDGVKTVACTAWNNAVDPQGNHNSSTSSVTVHIDEAPPTLSVEAVNPNDPTALVVDTTDGESGVAGGSIEMAPAGTSSWTPLPTAFTGSQLVAHVNDAGLRGPYTFTARSCDNVGNCASTSKTLALPARAQAVSEISLEQISATKCPGAPAKRAAAEPPAANRSAPASSAGQSLVADLSLSRDGGIARLRGSVAAATTVAGRALASSVSGALGRSRSHSHRRARIARVTNHGGGERSGSCGRSTARLATRANVAFGQPVRVQGLLMSSAGLPLAGQPIEILTAPDNGSNAFTQAAAVTTGLGGRWTATVPPGPSRIIRAVYPGSPTVRPASGQASTIVPAKIRIHINPRIVPWGSTLRITGQVLGGYVPTNSNLLRLNVGIGKIGHLEGLPKIDPDGRFVIIWKFNPGQGVLHPWFSVGTLSESAFPYAPGTSKEIVVTVGEPTPAGTVAKRHHRTARKHHKHKRTRKRRR